MSKDQNTGGAAKNRGAGAAATSSTAEAGGLNIPTLGSGSAAATGASQDGGAAGATSGADVAMQQSQPMGSGEVNTAQGAQQIQGGQPSMAEIQRQADEAQARGGSQAMHRPAFFRPDREQTAETPAIEMEMPLTGSLDNMRRPDQYIEPVVDFGRFKDKAAELAFLEEMVMIRIHETGDPNAEPVVQLGVNGRQVFIKRGEDVIVRRKYVEQLLRAKPENIQTNIRRDGDGNVRNMITKTRALKYPFSIVRDDNPMGRAWERKIRSEA